MVIAEATREKLLAAATQAFVASGFSGARVDLIARAAGVNKAMIYYHFRDKEGLYQAVLVGLMAPVHEHIALLANVTDPEQRLRAFYEGMIRRFEDGTALPRIMLQEILGGGRHIQPEAARAFSRILGFVAATLDEGRLAGRFRQTQPLVFHLSVLGPALLIYAGADFRERVLARAAPDLALPDLQNLIAHVSDAIARVVVSQA
jgi:TetR/AcrR family transcriptional regulator